MEECNCALFQVKNCFRVMISWGGGAARSSVCARFSPERPSKVFSERDLTQPLLLAAALDGHVELESECPRGLQYGDFGALGEVEVERQQLRWITRPRSRVRHIPSLLLRHHDELPAPKGHLALQVVGRCIRHRT